MNRLTRGLSLAVALAIVGILTVPMCSANVSARGLPPTQICGYVYDALYGTPIQGASVHDTTQDHSTSTNAQGYWTLPATVEYHYVTAVDNGNPGHSLQGIDVYCSPRTGIGYGDFNLMPAKGVYGYLTYPNGALVSGAFVYVTGDRTEHCYTNAEGLYYIYGTPSEWTTDRHYLSVDPISGYLTWDGGGFSYTAQQLSHFDMKLTAEWNMYQPLLDVYFTTSHFKVSLDFRNTTQETTTSSDFGGVDVNGVGFTIGGSNTQSSMWGDVWTWDSSMNTSAISYCVERRVHYSGTEGWVASYGNTVKSVVLDWSDVSNDRIIQNREDYKHSNDPDVSFHQPNDLKSGLFNNLQNAWGYRGYVVNLRSTSWSADHTFEFAPSIVIPSTPIVVTVKVGSGYSFSSSSTCTLSFSMWNQDASDAHSYGYWFEGGDSSRGAVLHLWELS